MSEKIVITVEQDKRIKRFIKNKVARSLLTCGVKGFTSPDNKCLNTIDIDQMARILYEPNSYEVEKPKFKIGDKVVPNFDPSNEVGTVSGVTECGKGLTVDFRTHMASTASVNFRHATKEEIFWAELGREVGEFVEGDVTLTNNGTPMYIDSDIDVLEEQNEYEKGRLKGFYPANSFIKLP